MIKSRRGRINEAEAITIRRGKTKAEETRPRRGRGNNPEARQDRGEALKHRGEAKAASFLPRGCLETHITDVM